MRRRHPGPVGVLAAIAIMSGCSPNGRPAPAIERTSASRDADADVRDFRMGALGEKVRVMGPGVDRDYFAGIFAARSGQTEESLALLTRAVPALRMARPDRAATALKALAETYLSASRYREAADSYDDLEQHFSEDLRPDVGDDAALARLVRDMPSQTVEWVKPVRLRTSRNPIGSLVSDITINRVHEQWLLDTGANQSVVSRSYARRLGLVPLAGDASVGSGITGQMSALHMAVVPQLPLGGAIVRNVIVAILDDADLRIVKGATDWTRRTIQNGGSGGTITRAVFVQPAVTMKIGDASIVLRNVDIASTRVNSGLDALFGNLGQDFFGEFTSFTLDFVRMTFSVKTAAAR